ncbi:MAG: ABC transporter ATP-binding protein [Chloroflexota bacterium]|nr:ABC transporter ATP-binding protein [Chloroflexota bacterium]
MTPALEVQDLHAYYGESHVLQGVSLAVSAGECIALLGRNGAGKTTTVSAISGLHRPRSGAVRIAGSDMAGRPPHEIARRGASLVPQGRRVFGELSVLENLTLTALPAPDGWDLERVLALFPSLRRRLDTFGEHLSGGEQQMLAIGRALMRNPAVLLLDEPSEGLAPKIASEVREVLGHLRDGGLAILLVEQNVALATRVADRIYVMNKGRIVFSGTSAELAAAPDVEARSLGI